MNILNSKEKNIIAIELTNNEKIVFSQLGINPLIKLGKEYLTSKNFVRLKENTSGEEKTLDNKKTTMPKEVKKISKSKEAEKIAINIESNTNFKEKSTEKINDNNEEIVSLNENDEVELKDEINNARKKRRRSSASIE